MQRIVRWSLLGFALCLATTAAVPARKGPAWISIEYPANPLDRTTKGAFLLVHAFHHGTPMGFPVSGSAEALVDGQRKSVTLAFESTSRAGVYALRRQWDGRGVWSLVITVTQGPGDNLAQALVEIAPDGGVSSVRVPTRQEREWTIPRPLLASEIEASLRRTTLVGQRP